MSWMVISIVFTCGVALLMFGIGWALGAKHAVEKTRNERLMAGGLIRGLAEEREALEHRVAALEATGRA